MWRYLYRMWRFLGRIKTALLAFGTVLTIINGLSLWREDLSQCCSNGNFPSVFFVPVLLQCSELNTSGSCVWTQTALSRLNSLSMERAREKSVFGLIKCFLITRHCIPAFSLNPTLFFMALLWFLIIVFADVACFFPFFFFNTAPDPNATSPQRDDKPQLHISLLISALPLDTLTLLLHFCL